MKKKLLIPMNLQYFGTPSFDPDTVTMQSARTGDIPRNISDQILTEVKQGSSIMRLAKEVRMTKPIEEFTYMTGVGAYWVAEAERIQTSKPRFVKAEMRAYKLGVIIPTTQENLDYSVTNFFELMRPEVAEAFSKKFDQSTFTGVESPFKQNILKAAKDAGNVVVESANKYDDINEAIAFIEEVDMEPNGIATSRSQRVKYRSTKDNNGMPIFNTANSNGVDDILGLPLAYTPKNTLGPNVAELVADWDYAYYGVLKGLEYKILDQATLTTVEASDGAAINLAERDMIALRATMTVGFMVVKDEAFSVVEKAENDKTKSNEENGTRSATGEIPLEQLKKEELQQLLHASGIEFPSDAKKDDLINLLKESE
ncbi:phage major capsid protein [Enterococcus mundtii]|uniref:phage major capsid protein n=1 Tax=Enterococcus mundtii TaxID=53346 RepID=UPI003369EE07